MIALLQRVTRSEVRINGSVHAQIPKGLLVFVGIEKGDTLPQADKLLEKILALRVFSDAEGKMNLSVKDVNGELLLVSQFTLAADTSKGLRPGFSSAMAPADANRIYNYLVTAAKEKHTGVASGQFAADMEIELVNDGPVTFILKT